MNDQAPIRRANPGSIIRRSQQPVKTCMVEPNMNDIDSIVKQVESRFGKGSIMNLGGNAPIQKVSVISTGSLGVDVALGVGGFARGRVIEIFGPESSGKTTLALHAVANAQANGEIAAFIDAEHALDVVYASNIGVNCEHALISQPGCGEEALDIADMLVKNGKVSIIIVDSVAALVPRAEIEGDMGDSHMGLHARMMSQACRKLAGAAQKSGTCIVFINQLRMKIGVVFGNPETTTGGNALKFYASARLDIRRIGAVKDGNVDVANRTRVRVVKNKLSPPFKIAEFDIVYGSGVSREGEIVDIGSNMGIVEKSGSWYSYHGERLGQGREQAKAMLQENQDLSQRIELEIREALK